MNYNPKSDPVFHKIDTNVNGDLAQDISLDRVPFPVIGDSRLGTYQANSAWSQRR